MLYANSAIRWARCMLLGSAFSALSCSTHDMSATASAGAPIDAGSDLEPATERTSLVDASAWQVMSASEDPFDDRPEDAACPEGAYMPEYLSGEPVFSVDTGGCKYLTARQPALRHIVAGEKLELRVWHFALHAGESALAHVAVRIGDKALLDTTVPIPSEGGLLHIEEVAPESIPEGAAVYFHLHNHGDNSWSFVELSAGPSH